MTYLSCACISSSDIRLNLPLTSSSPTFAISTGQRVESWGSRETTYSKYSICHGLLSYGVLDPAFLELTFSKIEGCSRERLSKLGCASGEDDRPKRGATVVCEAQAPAEL